MRFFWMSLLLSVPFLFSAWLIILSQPVASLTALSSLLLDHNNADSASKCYCYILVHMHFLQMIQEMIVSVDLLMCY